MGYPLMLMLPPLRVGLFDPPGGPAVDEGGSTKAWPRRLVGRRRRAARSSREPRLLPVCRPDRGARPPLRRRSGGGGAVRRRRRRGWRAAPLFPGPSVETANRYPPVRRRRVGRQEAGRSVPTRREGLVREKGSLRVEDREGKTPDGTIRLSAGVRGRGALIRLDRSRAGPTSGRNASPKPAKGQGIAVWKGRGRGRVPTRGRVDLDVQIA